MFVIITLRQIWTQWIWSLTASGMIGGQYKLCGYVMTLNMLLYTVFQKNIPDIFDCNLKTNYQILIICGTNIPDITCHHWLFSCPPHPTFVSALPGENETSEISFFYPMQYDCLINIMRKNPFCSHFWHFGWHFIQLSIFSTACSKVSWSVGSLCEHKQGDAFSIHWQQYR